MVIYSRIYWVVGDTEGGHLPQNKWGSYVSGDQDMVTMHPANKGDSKQADDTPSQHSELG